MEATFYAIARHGTAGLGWSFGYAELWDASTDGEPPRSDQTISVAGPLAQDEAAKIVTEWDAICDKYRDLQDQH